MLIEKQKKGLNFNKKGGWNGSWLLYSKPRAPQRHIHSPETEFVNLLRSSGIGSQPGGPVRQPYLTYWSAGLLGWRIPGLLQRLQIRAQAIEQLRVRQTIMVVIVFFLDKMRTIRSIRRIEYTAKKFLLMYSPKRNCAVWILTALHFSLRVIHSA